MKVLSFGSNSLGQLGHDHLEDLNGPNVVNLPSSIELAGSIKIVAGGNHTLLIHKPPQKYPSVWVTGDNSHHQCGRQNNTEHLFLVKDTKQTSFTSFSLPDDFTYWKFAAAGWTCTHLVSSKDELYACGHGQKGELGLGALNDSPSLLKIPDFPPKNTHVIDIHSSMTHTVVVLSDGAVYGFGNGRKGQLGLPALSEVRLPRRISLPEDYKAVKAVCGRAFTGFIDKHGKVIVLGDDKWKVVTDAPKSAIPDWNDMVAGWGALYVVRQNGEIVAWGRNTHGQLPPKDINPVEELVAGSEHCVAVEKGNRTEVLVWGWGEHGNCGALEHNEGECARDVKKIQVFGEVVNVGAGCATSWIIVRD